MQRAAIVLAACVIAGPVCAHPGRTDANGGHHDRKNGGYHYHNGGSRPSTPPASSLAPSSAFRSLERSAADRTSKPKPRPSRAKLHLWHSRKGEPVGQAPLGSYSPDGESLRMTEPVDGVIDVAIADLSLADRAAALDHASKHPQYRSVYKRWYSSDRNFHVYAKLCDASEDLVVLLKMDGDTIQVPMDRISDEDAEYIGKLIAFVRDVDSDDLDSESLVGKVVAVTNGDTIGVLVHRIPVKVRLEGIDSPEIGQPFGANAKQALSRAIFGKEVVVNVTGKDRYKRTLGVVMLNGRDVNKALVRAGYAWHFKKYNSDDQLAAAEQEARLAKRGLWADGKAIPPWDWRDGERGVESRVANTTSGDGGQ